MPYTVTNTTYGITSTAFIQVPAYGVFPPVLRPKAPALKVNARETITINIADYVRVGAGKTAYVDGADSVSATKAADGDLYGQRPDVEVHRAEGLRGSRVHHLHRGGRQARQERQGEDRQFGGAHASDHGDRT